jgi:MoaA/NifB/PqqE/SkfB family radical SAM enzyme
MISDTACVIPWSNLAIQPDGCASFCCDAPVLLTVDGRPGRLGQDTLEDLWNAEELVETRAAMARGERPETCRVCWKREAAGGVSRRLVMNDAYARGGGGLDVDALPLVGAQTGYRLERRPDWFILELGNVCNLRCRSCDPLFSSRVAADHVQSAWTAEGSAPLLGVGTGHRPEPAAPSSSVWFKDIDAMADMVASGAGENAMLSLIGGEPFLIKQTWQLLDALVKRGVSRHIFVGLLTNGQQRSSRLAELAPRFRGLNVSVSIDGYGRLYEYLRHGGSWSKLVENLAWLRELPNVSVAVVPTLQNANALDMSTLVRFLEQEQLSLTYNAVNWPSRLRPSNLPPSVRRRAAARLREYLTTECTAANATVVRGYCELLEAAGGEFDERLFHEFMTFTNDLDASRGEDLARAAPELVERLGEAGIAWSDARRYTRTADAAV